MPVKVYLEDFLRDKDCHKDARHGHEKVQQDQHSPSDSVGVWTTKGIVDDAGYDQQHPPTYRVQAELALPPQRNDSYRKRHDNKEYRAHDPVKPCKVRHRLSAPVL